MPNPTNTDNNPGAAATGTAAIRQIVENANAEDENLRDSGGAADDDDEEEDQGGDPGSDEEDEAPDDNDQRGADANNGDDAGDDDDDEGDPNDKGQPGPVQRRFSQFAGDGKPETYVSNLEKGYENSSKEAIKLNQELGLATSRVDAIMRAAATDADLADKLNAVLKDGGGDRGDGGRTPVDNPFVSDLQRRWEENSETEIEKFIEANPEVATDPKIEKDVKKWMNVISNEHLKDTGKLMSGGEAMAAAYRYLGLENKLGKQQLAQGAKKVAAPTRPQGGKRSNPSANKKSFTPEQIQFAKSMGKDQAWLEKNYR